MTEDPTDYDPRPADDFAAGLGDYLRMSPMNHNEVILATSLVKMKEIFCHQFGVPFSELPHALP